MDIAIVVFPQLTALDALGPYQVLTRLPDAAVADAKGAQVVQPAAQEGA